MVASPGNDVVSTVVWSAAFTTIPVGSSFVKSVITTEYLFAMGDS
jgi:hypothetical protein